MTEDKVETESILMIVNRAERSHLHISFSAETPPWMTVPLEHSVSPPGGESARWQEQFHYTTTSTGY